MKYNRQIKYTSCMLSVLLLSACGSTQQAYDVRPASNWDMAMESEKGESYYDRGKAYLAAGDYGAALDAFRMDISKNGPNVNALNGLGITYDKLARYDLSEKYYEQAYELQPESPITLSNLAYSQYKQGEYNNAVQLASAAQEMLEPMPVAAVEKEEIETEEAVVTAKAADYLIPEGDKTDETLDMLAFNADPEKEPLIQQVKVASVKADSVDRAIAKTDQEDVILPPRRPQIAVASIKPGRKPVRDETEMKVAAVLVDERHKSQIRVDKILARLKQDQQGPTLPERNDTEQKLVYRILNGTGRPKMAERMVAYLDTRNNETKKMGNSSSYGHERSVIEYAPGFKAQAMELAGSLPVEVEMKEGKSTRAPVELTLGADLLAFDTELFEKLAKKA